MQRKHFILACHVPTLTCVDGKLLRNMKYTSFISSEVSIMKSLTHPNIIKLFHLFQRRTTTYLVMEQASRESYQAPYMNGGL